MKKILIAVPVLYLTLSFLCYLHFYNAETARKHLEMLGWKPTVDERVQNLILHYAGKYPNRYTLGEALVNGLRYEINNPGGSEVAKGGVEICEQLLLDCSESLSHWKRREKDYS